MKETLFILLLVFFLGHATGLAQYRTWIYPIHPSSDIEKNSVFKGWFDGLTDSSIIIRTKDPHTKQLVKQDVEFLSIDRLHLRKSGRVYKHMITGGLIGAAVGAIAGLASGDDPSCSGILCVEFSAGEKAGQGAILLGPLGLALGALQGNRKIKIQGLASSDNDEKNKVLLETLLKETGEIP